MPLKSQDKKSFKKSIGYCLSGLSYAISNENNLKREIVLGIIALIAGVILKISVTEFLIVIIMISLVLTTEIINTAIERCVDLYTTKYNEMARIAKDVSAGAVLVMAFFSLVVGIIIFVPKIF